MNTSAMSWIPITVFVSKAYWGPLIREVVKPFLETLSFERTFLISFNPTDEGQESIRLAILVKKQDKDNITLQANAVFTDFFEVNKLFPEYATIGKDVPTSIFMPNYNNSLVFNDFIARITPYPHYFRELENAFHLMVIAVFAEQTVIDEELILTFAVYTFFTCYKVICASADAYSRDWAWLYKQRLTTEHYNTIDTVDNAFVTSAEEIYHQVFHGVESLDWLAIWEKEFEKSCKMALERDEIAFLFQQFDTLFNCTLGIQGRQELLLATIVSETLRVKCLVDWTGYFDVEPLSPIEL